MMGGRKPRQSDLKRSLSTAYYAVFHAMCRNAADTLIGTKGSDRSNPAWLQAYRAVAHATARNCCKNKTKMKAFPKEIEDFGNVFVSLQVKRESADYDPSFRVTRSEVLTDIDLAEIAISSLKSVGMKDRRAFAAWITLVNRSG